MCADDDDDEVDEDDPVMDTDGLSRFVSLSDSEALDSVTDAIRDKAETECGHNRFSPLHTA